MNIAINKNLINSATKLLIYIVILKLFSLIAIYMLPKHSIDKQISKSLNLPYYAIRLDKSFEKKQIKTQEDELQAEKKEELYPITNLVLKAIYGNKNDINATLIMVSKKGKTELELLAIGDKIEKYTFVQANLENKEAIFEANNKKFNLQMDTIKESKISLKGLSNSSKKSAKKKSLEDVILAVPRNEVLKYRKNFKEIWKNISIREELVGGKINGFRVLSIRPNTIFSKLGLKAGDIIKAVNNNKLKSYADAFQIYYKIENMKNIKITVIRKNEEKELEYEIY